MNTTEQPVAIVTGASSGLTVLDTFPPFSLTRVLRTVFYPKAGEKAAILIDLDDPHQVKNFAFLKNPDLTIQQHAYEVFYQGLKNGVLKELRLSGGDLLAYKITGGSNLDLPDLAVTIEGKEVSLERIGLRPDEYQQSSDKRIRAQISLVPG